MMKKIKITTLILILTLIVCLMPLSVSFAAEHTAIGIAKETIKLGIGETTAVTVDYSGLTGGFDDLAVISSDTGIAAATIADMGSGTAGLGIAATGLGTATVCVYSKANPAVAAYTVIQSGLSNGSAIINQTDGTSLTAIYNNRIIQYPPVLTGKNNAQMAVTALILEREKGIDCLKVYGELMAKDAKVPGMTTFYANYYDAAGGLMKRQAVYTRDPQANTHIELKWYVPDGCAKIVLE